MRQAIEYRTPPDAPPPITPTTRSLLGELTLGLTVARLVLAAPKLARLQRGGSPLVLIPGWKSPEASMEPLRRFLKSRGYQAQHWGLGTNQGDPEADREKVAELVTDIYEKEGQPVGLIGWSLGGVVARETARLIPDSVLGVVTYGTPVMGGPTYTLAGPWWGDEECERISTTVRELDETSPISVPIAAIFTRKDGVVSWPSCIDRYSPDVVHFEASSTHLGLGVDPTVWEIVAQQLGEFADRRGAPPTSDAATSDAALNAEAAGSA